MTITIRMCVQQAAIAAGISASELTGKSQNRKACDARSMAVKLARDLAAATDSAIGRHLGGRDHSTIANAIRRADERLLSSDEYRTKYWWARRELNRPKASETSSATAVARQIPDVNWRDMFPYNLPRLPTNVGTAPEAMRG